MDAKHTPGPWVYDMLNNAIGAIKPGDKYPTLVVCQMWSASGQSQVDADLIAAAPEMYEALQAIRQAFIDGEIRFTHKRQADSEPYHPANVKMCAAIAKAEGREP